MLGIKITSNFSKSVVLSNFLLNSVRNGHHLRGKPPGIARNLQQRLQELNYEDPELSHRIDIGLPLPQLDVKTKNEQIEILKKIRQDAELEKASRNKKLMVNLEESFHEWKETVGPKHMKVIADYYGIFRDLFGAAYFYPINNLEILYKCNDGKLPVYFGNIVKPEEAKLKPETVKFNSGKNELYTLIATNPDGNFTDNSKEYVHWFVGNIPEGNVEKGEEIIDYLQPFPPKGTGYHRFVFILYKQEKKLDFSKYRTKGYDLTSRNFSTLDFYREHQDVLTPASLAFFQSHWDKTLTKFYHEKLQMREPVFEYDFDPPFIRKEEWFPKRRPFNLYMDKYRDPKQINKEFLMRKMKNVHPFKEPEAPLPFPNAVSFGDKYVPSWLKLEIRKSRLKWGRINDIE